MHTCVIHDNYLDPFKVTFIPRYDCPIALDVCIYKYLKIHERLVDHDDEGYSSNPLKTFAFCRIFIPVDRDFYGNTLLLRFINNEYVYIGGEIFSFVTVKRKYCDTNSIITNYYSPIGASDLPYPYAFDEDNNTYLLLDYVILNKVYTDPYEYYYNARLITEDCGYVPPKQPMFQNKYNIINFFIEDNQYTLCFDPDIESTFNRLTDNNRLKMYIICNNSMNEKKEFSKLEYLDLMQTFGHQIGVCKLERNTLVKRTHPWLN